MQEQEQKYYSAEEYLKLETVGEYRNEYSDGKISAMAQESINHNQIVGNLFSHLNLALKEQRERVFVLDVRLLIPRKQVYTYPDVILVSEQAELAQGQKDTITNAIMVAEVLSESTENYDRGKKFKLYRNLPSFKEYLIIEQSEMYIEQFSKTADNKWILSEYEGTNAVLALSSVEFQIPLLDIYNKVNFEEDIIQS